jgi:hypothetical protein
MAENVPDRDALLVVAVYAPDGRMLDRNAFDYRSGHVPMYELFFCGDFQLQPYARAFWVDAISAMPLLPDEHS